MNRRKFLGGAAGAALAGPKAAQAAMERAQGMTSIGFDRAASPLLNTMASGAVGKFNPLENDYAASLLARALGYKSERQKEADKHTEISGGIVQENLDALRSLSPVGRAHIAEQRRAAMYEQQRIASARRQLAYEFGLYDLDAIEAAFKTAKKFLYNPNNGDSW
jgi:hypothetical protein